MTYIISHGNTGSLIHWARLGIEPTPSWFLRGFVNHWAMKGTPEEILKYWLRLWGVGGHRFETLLCIFLDFSLSVSNTYICIWKYTHRHIHTCTQKNTHTSIYIQQDFIWMLKIIFRQNWKPLGWRMIKGCYFHPFCHLLTPTVAPKLLWATQGSGLKTSHLIQWFLVFSFSWASKFHLPH